MREVEVLRKARALIEKPENWAGSCGQLVRGSDRHCMVTALTPMGPAYELLLRVTGAERSHLSRWNDTHTHAEVLRAFDLAIALAEEQTAGSPLPPAPTPLEQGVAA